MNKDDSNSGMISNEERETKKNKEKVAMKEVVSMVNHFS
jgi:hypothetical protein